MNGLLRTYSSLAESYRRLVRIGRNSDQHLSGQSGYNRSRSALLRTSHFYCSRWDDKIGTITSNIVFESWKVSLLRFRSYRTIDFDYASLQNCWSWWLKLTSSLILLFWDFVLPDDNENALDEIPQYFFPSNSYRPVRFEHRPDLTVDVKVRLQNSFSTIEEHEHTKIVLGHISKK